MTDDSSPRKRRRKGSGEKQRRKGKSFTRSRSYSEEDDDSNDDNEGEVTWREGDYIRNKRYKIVDIAGQGTFGTVLDVHDSKYKERVVLKVVRSVKRYLEAAYVEIDILEKLRKADPTKGSHIVRLYGSFTCEIKAQKHVCICFEKLGRSLYEFIKKNQYRGFKQPDLRAIGRQLIHAIRFCHSVKLTHTDLKLENVLFYRNDYDVKDGIRIPKDVRIRVIDFGGATFEGERHARIINTRQYRAPEVILGLTWNESSDMWAIGCILAELCTGELLFQTHSDKEHIALMEKILYPSQMPTRMVKAALEPYKRLRPGDRDSTRLPEAPVDKIFEWENYELAWPKIAENKESERHVKNTEILKKLIGDRDLVDLIRLCLEFNPNKRITAADAFGHRYFDGETVKLKGQDGYMKIKDRNPPPAEKPISAFITKSS